MYVRLVINNRKTLIIRNFSNECSRQKITQPTSNKEDNYPNEKDTKESPILSYFKKTDASNILQYNKMLSILASKGLTKEAEKIIDIIYDKAYDESSTLNESTKQKKINKVLPNYYTFHFLIRAYAAKYDGANAEKTLVKMEEKGLTPRIYEWNSVLEAYSRAKDYKNFHNVYRKLKTTNICPDKYTWGILINTSIKQDPSMKKASEIFKQMLASTEYKYESHIWTSMIIGYSDAENAKKCLEHFNSMKELGINPTIDTFNALFRACGKCDQCNELTFDLFKEMKDVYGIEADKYSYYSLIHAAAKFGDVLKLFEIKRFLDYTGKAFNNIKFYCVLLNGISRAQEIENCRKAFSYKHCSDGSLSTERLFPYLPLDLDDIERYHPMKNFIEFQRNNITLCEKTLNEMVNVHNIKPDVVLLTNALKVYTRALFVDEAKLFFETAFKKYDIKPNLHTFIPIKVMKSRIKKRVN